MDASDYDLTRNGEDVDALAFTGFDMDTPQLVLSTLGVARVGPTNTKYSDEDLLLLNRETNTWQRFFDGSVVKMTKGSEDTSSAWIEGNNLLITTNGNYVVKSLNRQQGDSNEIILCERQPEFSCLFGRYWKGAMHGFRRESIDALTVGLVDSGRITGRTSMVMVDESTVIDFEIDLREEDAVDEEVDRFDLMQPEEDEEVLRYQLWLPEIQR